jgi:3-hydroxyisobutyrate dehydrogenase
MQVGLIGLGKMGAAIFQRLKDHGIEVVGWDRNAEAVRALAAKGLHPVSNPRTVAKAADTVISIITEDEGVRNLFLGDEGFFSAAIDGKLFIEMSTLRPATHRELSPLVAAKGAHLIDAPVMGSIPTVRDGKLLVLAGGEAADVERAKTVLDCLARRIVHMGPAGSGCAMKLAVNLGMALYLQALAEAIALTEVEGLSLDRILEILSEAPTASPFLKGKMGVLKGDPSDITLDIRTLRKDVMSAVATGAAGGVSMPAASGAVASLSAAIAGGWGDKDLAELPRYFREFMTQVFQ